MSKGLIRLWLGGAVLTALAARCFASTAFAVGDKVYVNEQLVLTFRYGTSARLNSRAQTVAARLARLDAQSPLELRIEDSIAKIISGDQVILIFDQDEADAQHQSVNDLAEAWFKNIKQALNLPAIQLSKSEVKLQVGGKAQVLTLGSEIEKSEVSSSDDSVIAIFHKRDTLFIRAIKLGDATVTVAGPTSSQSVKVRVLPLAADLPQTINVDVTGDPATKETVNGVIEGAVRTKLMCAPDAEVQYTPATSNSLALEGTAEVKMPVHVSAPDAFPAEGDVIVRIHNIPLAARHEAELWYSNDPENVTQAGNLFAAELKRESAARLLYHHYNKSGVPLDVYVRVLNQSNKDAKVLIIPGDSPPDRNPVLAGFKAGDQFLRNWICFSGEVVDVPANSQIPVSLRKLWPGQTVSGLCYLRLLEGGPSSLLVRADALSPELIDASHAIAYETSTPWRVCPPEPVSDREVSASLSDDVYPSPFKDQDLVYKVGGKFGFVRIGQKPLISRDEHQTLDGNFGVVYTIHAAITNPTSVPADVEMVFESSAGYSGGLFVVDGNFVRTPLLHPKEEIQIAKIHVEPGDTKTMTVLTCPLSGSSYPATLTIRPTNGFYSDMHGYR